MQPNWENRTLFHGDNLKFLRAMNSESVDLIATDPPFNKGRDFHATPDSLAAGAKFQDRWSWERDVHDDWLDQLQDDNPRLMEAINSARHAHSDGMGAYLCFMAVRLLAMRRVLKETGSIYLHCDPTASHYLKAVMDAIFGWQNFINEIVWHYRKWASGKFTFQRNHDLILFYGRSHSPATSRTFNQIFMPRAESTNKRFGNSKIISGHDASGKRIPSTVSGESEGVRLDDVWDFNRVAPIKQIYPTQKPLPLYERIIKASSNEGDIVLDPFAGCATTLVAAEKLSRQWVGIDIWEGAHQIVVDRLNKAIGPMLGQVNYTKTLPERSDDGETASPFLRVRELVKEPEGPRWSRARMYDYLIEQHGSKCQGCDRIFDDPRYLELDHNIPRSDGGMNHITNRILLCGPCNKVKSNVYTLSGLRRENIKRGYMK